MNESRALAGPADSDFGLHKYYYNDIFELRRIRGTAQNQSMSERNPAQFIVSQDHRSFGSVRSPSRRRRRTGVSHVTPCRGNPPTASCSNVSQMAIRLGCERYGNKLSVFRCIAAFDVSEGTALRPFHTSLAAPRPELPLGHQAGLTLAATARPNSAIGPS